MVIGKTSVSISASELFEKYSELQILTTVFPEIDKIPCKISSPFRSDSNPSFGIYMDDNKHIRFKDFGDSNCKGSLLDLLCMKWNCSFRQVFGKILEVMQKNTSEKDLSPSIKSKQVKVLTRKEYSDTTKIQVAVRPWQQYDYDYWNSYGITKPWLKYAEIYPTSHKIITKKDKETGKTKKFIFPTDKYCYTYVERKDGNLSIKLYQPYNTNGYKWCSKMDSSVIGLWTKIPEYGDRVVICSSIKDALVLSCQCHIPALCLQGEGYSMSQTAVNELKRRYKNVFICFDTDTPGIEDAKKLSQQTGFPYIVPDLKGEKILVITTNPYKTKKTLNNLNHYFINFKTF